jgi:regulator of sigma E protease
MGTLYFILSLSILVLLHEMGHFLAARATGTRVEKFYLFFDFLFPLPNVLNFAIVKKKIGDTEYGIGWFPLGGYVKIAGMMDESMDEEAMKQPPLPDEYRSKNNGQKLIIMLGGIIMNILLGWLIYSQLLYWNGEMRLPAEGVKSGIQCDTIALQAGFHNGDIIMSHDGGKKFQSFISVPAELLLDNIKTVEVERNGRPVTIVIPADFVAKAVASRGHTLFDFNRPCIVGDLTPETVVKGKLKKGDRIIKINDSVVNYFAQSPEILSHFKGQPITITFLRDNDTMHTAVTVPHTGVLGFFVANELKYYKGSLDFQEIHYGLIQSFGAGAVKAYQKMRDYLKQFKLIFSPTVKGYKQLGGFGTMASMFGSDMDLVGFLSLTAFISLMLAIMNLLPIPMLDGGYVVMLLIEMVIRRPLDEKVVENIQKVGFVFIIALMLFANGNDLYRWVMTKFMHG